jgi:hypothetical protein
MPTSNFATSRGPRAALSLLALAALTAPVAALAQAPGASEAAPVASVRVTDARLETALRRLVAASPSAAAVVAALSASGLQVAVGTPSELAALPDSDGGPAPAERSALLADPGSTRPSPEPPIAWVVFRVAPPTAAAAQGGPGTVERAWVAVEADSVERWIRAVDGQDAGWRIEEDYLAILAHEFVAHVGSIAASRRLDDFCDDPPPGPSPGAPGELACSLRVENRVRRELNQGLGLTGKRKLPERRDYTLQVMNFARAHTELR